MPPKDANKDLKLQLRKDKDADKELDRELQERKEAAGSSDEVAKKQVRIAEQTITDEVHHQKLLKELKGVIDSNNNDDGEVKE